METSTRSCPICLPNDRADMEAAIADGAPAFHLVDQVESVASDP